jgi:uncharacterized protein YegP (UPF0339 family)
MTRSEPVAHAITALRTTRTTSSPLPEATALTFVVYEDNSGGYRWTIIADSGKRLVQSARYASYEQAEQDARSLLPPETVAGSPRQPSSPLSER